MVNNVAKIRELLKFPDKNSFYFLEIIKRRKENPEMEKGQKLIRDFYIYSFEEFDVVAEKAIQLCDENNARAYFRLNRRDAKKIAFMYNKRLAELLITEDYKAIPKSYASVVGEFHSDEDKTWVVDIDHEDYNESVILMHQICGYVKTLQPEGEKVVTNLKTKNGIHLITRPFRLDKFKEKFPSVDVHKDNPTILYVP